MATPIKDSLNVKLSYKLGSGVSTATSDGEGGFSAILRNDYLIRAYGRLMRTLGAYVKDLADIFPSMYKFVGKTSLVKADAVTPLSLTTLIADGGIDLTANNLSAVEEIYFATSLASGGDATKKWVNCSKQYPENYMATKFATNAEYKPNSILGSEVFYYSIINGKIVFVFNAAGGEYAEVGRVLSDIQIFMKNDTTEIASATKDIMIPSQYHDLLLTMAALEAMYDQGDQVSLNKAQIYASDIDRQVNILRDVRQMELNGNDIAKQRGEK